MANLSNINDKFLFTDGDFLLIGGATANSISATESGVAIKNSNAATLSLQNSATNGKNHTLWSNTDGSFNITDVGVATRFTIASGGDVYIPSGNVSIGNTSVYPSGSNTILQIYSVSVPRLKLQNSTTGTAATAGSSFYVTGDDLIINNGETGAVIQFEIGGQSKMRIDGDGNVGIGTISPDSILHVSSTGANAYSSTINGSGVAENMVGIRNVITSNGDDMVGIYFATGSSTSGTHWSGITGSRSDNASHWGTQLNFYTHDNDVAQLTEATQKMVIKGNGNVGIGTTDPQYKFDVNQGASSGVVIPFRVSGGSMTASGDGTSILLTNRYDAVTGGDYGGYVRIVNTKSSPQFLNPRLEFGVQNLNTNVISDVDTKMTILGTGNVGIGTTSPVVKLNVVGSAYFSGNDAWNGGGSEGNKTDIALVIDEGDTIYTRDSNQYLRTLIKKDTGDNIQIGEAGTSLIDNINFFSGSSCSYTWHNNSSAAMKLTSTGLGIGTTSPSAKLDVVGYAQIDSYTANDSGNTPFNSGYLKLIAGAKTGWGVGDQLGKIEFYGTDTSGIGARTAASIISVCENGNGTSTTTFSSGLAFYTSSYNANQSEKLRINNDGLVGIGTDSPAEKLEIEDSLPFLQIKGLSSGEFGLKISDSSNIVGGLTYSSTTGEQRLRGDQSYVFQTIYSGGSERMRITSGGNVLIGTDSTTVGGVAGHKLVIDATSQNLGIKTASGSYQAVRFANGTTAVGSINLTTSATSYSTSSDYRLKENVVEMTGALDRVSQLKPSRFNFIAYANTTVDGFLAHEVQEIVPEAITGEKDAVDEEGNPKYQGIDQSKLVPLLVGAIQELKAEIETLKTQINN